MNSALQTAIADLLTSLSELVDVARKSIELTNDEHANEMNVREPSERRHTGRTAHRLQ